MRGGVAHPHASLFFGTFSLSLSSYPFSTSGVFQLNMSDEIKDSFDLRFVYLMVLVLLVVVLVRTAWLSDDAFFTLRTVDNFVNGYGPRFNVLERVQAYTHPLWFFLLSLVYFFTREAYFTTLLVSIGLTIGVVAIFLRKIAVSEAAAVFGVIALTLSKAFIDYSTSGLENPLSHLIMGAFLWIFLTKPQRNFRQIWLLSLLAALGTLNRLDTGVLYAPMLLFILWETGAWKTGNRWRAVQAVGWGFLPLIAWEVFSIIYYGFPFPNTAYAKLALDVPKIELWILGIKYYISSINIDPITLLLIGVGAGAAALSRKPVYLAVVAGIVFYMGYIIWIGGDFMNGRFFSTPLLCAVAIICHSEHIRTPAKFWLPFLIISVIGLFSPLSPIRADGQYGLSGPSTVTVDPRGVDDERAYYYPYTGLLRECNGCVFPNYQVYPSYYVNKQGKIHIEANSSGMYGFAAGPSVYLVDRFGLADPLLARLPQLTTEETWRSGHYPRALPDGYLESRAADENLIVNPHLAEFYDHLSLITRGDLFTVERWTAIWKMNTGQYDDLIDAYFQDQQAATPTP